MCNRTVLWRVWWIVRNESWLERCLHRTAWDCARHDIRFQPNLWEPSVPCYNLTQTHTQTYTKRQSRLYPAYALHHPQSRTWLQWTTDFLIDLKEGIKCGWRWNSLTHAHTNCTHLCTLMKQSNCRGHFCAFRAPSGHDSVEYSIWTYTYLRGLWGLWCGIIFYQFCLRPMSGESVINEDWCDPFVQTAHAIMI